jgi:hypothetical protein
MAFGITEPFIDGVYNDRTQNGLKNDLKGNFEYHSIRKACKQKSTPKGAFLFM